MDEETETEEDLHGIDEETETEEGQYFSTLGLRLSQWQSWDPGTRICMSPARYAASHKGASPVLRTGAGNRLEQLQVAWAACFWSICYLRKINPLLPRAGALQN